MAEMTELRQTENTFILNGLLTEKVVTYGTQGDDSYIALSLSVETDKGTYTVRGRQTKLTKSGKENGFYKSYKTVAEEYKAINNTIFPDANNKNVKQETTNSREEADYISLTVNIRENMYVSQRNELVETQQYNLQKFRRVNKDDENYPIGFKGVIEGCVGGIEDEYEFDNETPTGRAIMQLFVVNYGGKVMPLPIAIDKEIVDAVKSLYNKGDTVKIDVEIKNHHIGKVVEETTSAFGKENVAKAHIVEGYDVTEFNCISGNVPETDVDLILNPQLIGKALTERENYKKEVKDRGYQGKKKTVNTQTQTMAQINPATIESEDIPF